MVLTLKESKKGKKEKEMAAGKFKTLLHVMYRQLLKHAGTNSDVVVERHVSPEAVLMLVRIVMVMVMKLSTVVGRIVMTAILISILVPMTTVMERTWIVMGALMMMLPVAALSV
jgi:hypothetical protein